MLVDQSEHSQMFNVWKRPTQPLNKLCEGYKTQLGSVFIGKGVEQKEVSSRSRQSLHAILSNE